MAGILGDMIAGGVAGYASEVLRQGQAAQAEEADARKLARTIEAQKDVAKFSAELGWDTDQKKMEKQSGLDEVRDKRKHGFSLEEGKQQGLIQGELAKSNNDAAWKRAVLGEKGADRRSATDAALKSRQLGLAEKEYADGALGRITTDHITVAKLNGTGSYVASDSNGKLVTKVLDPESIQRVDDALAGKKVDLSSEEKQVYGGKKYLLDVVKNAGIDPSKSKAANQDAAWKAYQIAEQSGDSKKITAAKETINTIAALYGSKPAL